MSITIDSIAIYNSSFVFFLLLFCHFLADFPLQGDYMAKAKDPTTNPFGIWSIVLFGHCMIHAGFVFLITQKLSFALFQLITHFTIDYAKCKCKARNASKAFALDQFAHIYVLLLIALLATSSPVRSF